METGPYQFQAVEVGCIWLCFRCIL